MGETTKHTPGPWEIDGRCSTRVVAGDRSICTTAGPSSSVEDLTPENEANARLITAAPDLLRACKAIHEDICDRLLDVESPGTRQTLTIQRNFLAAAITKAEG